MNERVDQQMTTRVYPKELAIDHVRNPGERMPICGVKGGERPGESRERKAAIHHWIFLDICRVIERDEVMPDYLRVDPKRRYRETEQDGEIGSLQSCSVAKRDDASSLRRSNNSSFSLSRCSFGHLFAGLQEGGTSEISTVRKAFKLFLRREVQGYIRLQPARLPLQ